MHIENGFLLVKGFVEMQMVTNHGIIIRLQFVVKLLKVVRIYVYKILINVLVCLGPK